MKHSDELQDEREKIQFPFWLERQLDSTDDNFMLVMVAFDVLNFCLFLIRFRL